MSIVTGVVILLVVNEAWLETIKHVIHVVIQLELIR